MSHAVPADPALLAEFVHRSDGGAFSKLVERHGPLVIGVCRNVLLKHHDAEDAAQATFLTLARKADSLLGHPSLAGWLHTVAWHTSMRARQARQLRSERERKAEGSPHDAVDTLSAAEQSAKLHEAIESLPEKYRLPIVLHHLEGWSEAEAAELLGAKLGTVSGWLSRGRLLLRERLAKSHVAVVLLPGALWQPRELGELTAALAGRLAAPAADASPMVNGLTNAALRALDRQSLVRWIGTIALIVCIVGGASAVAGWAIFNARQSALQTAEAAAESAHWISGTLSGPSGRGVNRASVYLYYSLDDAKRRENIVATKLTDAEGTFRFDELARHPTYYLVIGVRYNVEPPPANLFRLAAQSSSKVEHEVILIPAPRRN